MKELILVILNNLGKGMYLSFNYPIETEPFIPKIEYNKCPDSWCIIFLWFVFGFRHNNQRYGMAIGLTFLYLEFGGYCETT